MFEIDTSTASAAFAGTSAVAAIVTAGIAGWSLIGAYRDSRDRTRPVVTARLRIGPRMAEGYIYLTISNQGASAARDVAISFHPPLPDYQKTDDGQDGVVAPVLRRRYAEPVTIIGIGESLNNLYWYQRGASNEPAEPVPAKFSVGVKYQDDRGRSYEDSFPLDVATIAHETQSFPGGQEWSKITARAANAIPWELWNR